MANLFRMFLDLIPKDPEFVGTITAALHPNYKVLVVDGTGLVECRSNTVYSVGNRVLIQGQVITQLAQSGSVIIVEV